MLCVIIDVLLSVEYVVNDLLQVAILSSSSKLQLKPRPALTRLGGTDWLGSVSLLAIAAAEIVEV